MSNPKDYFEELKFSIEDGNNVDHRKIAHATYAVKTVDMFGDIVYGIQYHNTVIFAIRENGGYFINNGGYFTKTTLKRINEALRQSGRGAHCILQRHNSWLMDGVDLSTSAVACFDVNHNNINRNLSECWGRPVVSVVDKNGKVRPYRQTEKVQVR